MVRAPPGYAIGGRGRDSEELWISSAMGDAAVWTSWRHGGRVDDARGYQGCGNGLALQDSGILGLSRDQAKVFKLLAYIRCRHAPCGTALTPGKCGTCSPNRRSDSRKQLYASTKGKNTQRTEYSGTSFWFWRDGEFRFNKLEESRSRRADYACPRVWHHATPSRKSTSPPGSARTI